MASSGKYSATSKRIDIVLLAQHLLLVVAPVPDLERISAACRTCLGRRQFGDVDIGLDAHFGFEIDQKVQHCLGTLGHADLEDVLRPTLVA